MSLNAKLPQDHVPPYGLCPNCLFHRTLIQSAGKGIFYYEPIKEIKVTIHLKRGYSLFLIRVWVALKTLFGNDHSLVQRT